MLSCTTFTSSGVPSSRRPEVRRVGTLLPLPVVAVRFLDASTKFVVVSALGLGCTEKEVGHPYLSPLNVRRRGKRLAL
jgi:hypothetical protein